MCTLNLVTLQCNRVKLSSILLVTFLAFGTLQTVPYGLVSQMPAHWDQRIFYRVEESLFWGNLACSSFSTKEKRRHLCIKNVLLASYWSGKVESVNILPTLPNWPSAEIFIFMSNNTRYKQYDALWSCIYLIPKKTSNDWKKYYGFICDPQASSWSSKAREMICPSYTTAERTQFLSGKMTLTLPAHLQKHTSAFIHISIVYY